MLRKLAMLIIAAGCVSGCGGRPQPQPPAATQASMPLVACDDGGSGGVLIDGICL